MTKTLSTCKVYAKMEYPEFDLVVTYCQCFFQGEIIKEDVFLPNITNLSSQSFIQALPVEEDVARLSVTNFVASKEVNKSSFTGT